MLWALPGSWGIVCRPGFTVVGAALEVGLQETAPRFGVFIISGRIEIGSQVGKSAGYAEGAAVGQALFPYNILLRSWSSTPLG